MNPVDPSTPVGICGCGEIIQPSEERCWECVKEGVDPVDLTPMAMALVLLFLAGSLLLSPLVWSLWTIWRGR